MSVRGQKGGEINGNKESSGEETGGEEDSEEDRKEEIGNLLWNFGLEKAFSSLFFCPAVFLRYETPFSKKIQGKFTTY